MNTHLLQTGLLVAGLTQAIVSVLNLDLPRLFKWREPLKTLPLLLREVFQVHLWFISVTLAIFAVLTLRFAGELAAGTNPLGGWLAACIGGFWAIRTVMQLAYYSTSHWRGQKGRTAIHIALLIAYSGLAATYLAAAVKALS